MNGSALGGAINEFKSLSNASDRAMFISGFGMEEYKTIQPLVREALSDQNYLVRSAAVKLFGEIGDAASVADIFPRLNDRHYEVRYVTAEVLGEFNSVESIDPLILALRDKEELVRINAAQSLGRLCAKAAISALVDCLYDKKELVRGYAAEALGEIGDAGVVPALRGALATEKRNAARLRICAALYVLGDKDVFLHLLRFMSARNYRVRCAAARVLSRLADTNNAAVILQALENRFDREHSVAVKDAISQSIGDLVKAGLVG